MSADDGAINGNIDPALLALSLNGATAALLSDVNHEAPANANHTASRPPASRSPEQLQTHGDGPQSQRGSLSLHPNRDQHGDLVPTQDDYEAEL